jgi:colanic acid/amylovoran biosynthesis protein
MKKIVIAGASTYGVKNHGDDAMFSNLVTQLQIKIPDCNITLLARHPNEEFDSVFSVTSLKNFDHDSKKQSIGRWFYGFNPDDKRVHLNNVFQAIDDCDLLIIGGNALMEVSTNDFLRGVASYSALLVQIAKILQKPYVIYGMAVSPLENNYTKQIAKFICENATIVTVREEFSKKNLINAEINDKNIYVLGDPVYGLEPTWNKNKAVEILKNEKIIFRPDDNIIGIGFRSVYWTWKENEFNKYAKKMACLCDFMIENFNARLLFIPNCTYNIDSPYEDDRIISESIKNQMKFDESAYILFDEYTLPEILSLFQLLKMHVSNRRHSCIFAAIHKIPFLAMSTEEKYVGPWHMKPFMEDLSVPNQGVSFTGESLDFLTSKLNETWENRATLSSELSKSIPPLKTRSQQYADLFCKILDNHN